MAKTRYKPEELTQQGEPEVATLPSEQPVSPFLDPSVAQAEPQGSELYSLGTVQQRAASTQGADMYMPSYLQAPRNYPTGAEGGATRPEGASPMLYPSQAETQPRVRARYKPEEALAIAEANRPKRYSPDQMLDVAAESMFDASQQPLPKELWKAATQRRAEMVKDGRLPMEFGQIDSLKDGIVWAANSLYGVGSYLVSAPIAAAVDFAKSPIESRRQMHATAAATVKRLSTEFGLQTYQDIFNLTHEPKYRVKETGQFVAVNKTGLPLVLPAASGGNNVISGDGIISPVTPEAGIRRFAKEGMTLVPTTGQDLEDYRYGQYLDRMGIGAQSIEDMKAKAPPELVAALVSGNWDSVEPNQAQTELALLAAQAAIPVGGSARTWGVGRKVAAGISKAAEKVEAVAGFPVDVDTALRANFVKAVTSGTGADAVAQKTAMQAAIDAGKTTAKVGGAYGVAAGVSSFEGTPSEIKDLAWTAANLYTGYKSSMYVARQLRAASGFTKTVLKEVADPSRGLDAGARAAVAANPAVPQSVREVLESPSRYRALESTPARLAKNPELSPTSRAVFDKLSDYRFVQAARLTRDAAAGVPKGITLNAPFIAGALASDDPERAGQMIAAGGLFGAVGGTASRFTEANMRRGEEATSDIARMLVDIQAGNELGSGLGGEIMRNRVRPGTRFQDGERGFVMPEQEVASFLTEMEMAGADVAAFVQGKSFDELAQWAAYQGFFRDKVDLVPLNARDYKLNAEANGHSGAGAYFLQPSEGRRARIFVNAESRRNGLAPHEYGHAVLRGGALSPDQIDAVHADINGRYTPDALKAMAGEYAASMVRAENVKAGIGIDPSPASIEAKVAELSQGSMVKGSADGLDWLREEVFAEEFRNANIDLSRARRNIPLGANPVSFMENLLGAQSRALHMAGIDIDPQTGKPMGRDQVFKENRVAAGDPVVMKNYEAYVRQWRQWIKDPTHEIDPGVAVSRTGNVQDTANNPNVTWRDYGGGRLENEFGIKNPDGTVTPKDWNKDIKPTVRARQQAVREMSNRSKQVSSADDPTFGMRTQRDGRRVISGRYLPDSFFFIPQYKPFHSDIRKIVAADGAGETLQVRYYAKGKSKDVFKDGVNGVNAVNREAMHGNFVAKKDGTLMWGYLDMTQFRNRAMKAIADRNPALEPYNWDFKALMDDVPTHLRDQASGRGGAVTVGPERANVLNGLIGIGTGPLVGAFGKGTAYKTIHLDSIDAVVPTGKQGGQFDVYRANRNAMPDDPKPPVDMMTDLTPDNNNRMPSALPQAGMAMPEVPVVRGQAMPDITITPDEARRRGLVGPVYHGSPDFKGHKFDPKYRARSSGISRGGFSFSDNVASADGYAGAGVDSAQAAVDSANDVMREAAGRMERGLKVKGFSAADELPEFNVRYVDDISELSSYFNELAKDMPKDLAARLRDAAKQVNEPANPVVVEAYLRNPKTMDIDGKKLWLVDNPDDIFVSAARPPQGAATGRARGQAMPDVASTDRVTSYHLTDDPKFSLNRAKRPQNNTTLGGDWPNAGIFVGPSAEAWFNGYDYVRPFVVELSHPPIKDMGSKAMDVAGYGGEQFIPAEAFDSVRVERVIPYDEYAREQFGEYGPIESYNEIDAQGRALPQITGSFGSRDTAPLKNYKYSGKDVRNMSPAQQRALAERTEKYARGERPQLFADEQTATSRTRGQAMPDAAVTQDGLVQAPEDAPKFKLPRQAMAQFMPDTGVDLADYADRTVLALPADRMGIGSMMVGPKGKEREVSVKGQGGAGFMEIYNGGGWAFSDEATGNRFMKRLREAAEPGEGSVLVGITAMSEFNHLKNQTGQLAYVEALEAAIAGKSISKKQADAHIKAISQSIMQSTAKSVTDSTRRKFAAIKNFNDFAKAVRNKSLNFADAAPYSVQIARKALPIPYKEAKDIGIAFDNIGKQTADPRYADVPFGTVVALLEVPLEQAPVRSDFHYSYPFKVTGRSIGFLKQYYDVGQLTSDPRIRNSAGAVQAQPLQTVLPKLDQLPRN